MAFHKGIITKYPDRIFWSSFFLLNFLLFVPMYLFYRTDASFWPWERPFDPNLAVLAPRLFLQRPNPDIFRLNVELLLLVLIGVFVKPVRRRWFVYLTFFFYLLQMSYAVYEGFIRSYYLLDPVFYNDFFLFADGTRYLLRSLYLAPTLYLGMGLVFVLGVGLLFGLNELLFAAITTGVLKKRTRFMLAGIAVGALVPMVLLKGAVGVPETAVSSFTAKIVQNIRLSQVAKAESHRFDSEQLSQFYQFTQEGLREKPDIYVIFLESYGSVLTKRADFRYAYEQLLAELETRLDDDRWLVASTRSNAPTWGGGSWISYTSTLSGLRLNSHAQYLAMFNRYSHEPFPHLFNYLRTQGYRSYRLSSTSDVLNNIEWQRYKEFYGIDEWLRFPDLAYQGPLFGWGPAPPDQYALNYAHEYMNRDTVTPHVFFYITQNSHYPWSPLPDVAPVWQTLNDAPPAAPLPSQGVPLELLRQQYLASIEYELTMLVDFITMQADENDLIVIIGDHQPARVARYADGWDTPMHIISRDKAFIESFYDYGFVPGLATHTLKPTMQHEGFYSLFMHLFLQQYGLDPANSPAYMPDGIPLN